MLTGFANWSQSKVEKPWKCLLKWGCEKHDDEFRSDDDNDDDAVWFPVTFLVRHKPRLDLFNSRSSCEASLPRRRF